MVGVPACVYVLGDALHPERAPSLCAGAGRVGNAPPLATAALLAHDCFSRSSSRNKSGRGAFLLYGPDLRTRRSEGCEQIRWTTTLLAALAALSPPLASAATHKLNPATPIVLHLKFHRVAKSAELHADSRYVAMLGRSSGLPFAVIDDQPRRERLVTPPSGRFFGQLADGWLVLVSNVVPPFPPPPPPPTYELYRIADGTLNGARIAFYRMTYNNNGQGIAKSDLFVRNGTRNTNITAHSSAQFFVPSWAPNGRMLVAIRGQGMIVSMRPNGTGVRVLTSVSGAYTGIADAVYSPDGKKIRTSSAPVTAATPSCRARGRSG